MTIFDDIRKDREAGTPGNWEAVVGPVLSAVSTVQSETLDYDDVGYFTLGDHQANARRIARVPRLERIAMAAEQVVDAVLRSDPWEDIDATIAAFRAACGEGE